MIGIHYTIAAYAIALGLIFSYAIVLTIELRAALRRDRNNGGKP